MTRWAPRLTDVMDELAAEILHNYGKGRALVAVDGLAGTTEFADGLAEAVKRTGHAVFRASMRDFRHRRKLRYPAGSMPDHEPYDVDTLHRVLIEPFRDGATGSFVLAAFDSERDMPIEPKWMTAKPDAVLIIDGEELQLPELRGLWHYSVWLETPTEPSTEQARYLAQAKPSSLATAIYDGADPEHPRRVFADSC